MYLKYYDKDGNYMEFYTMNNADVQQKGNQIVMKASKGTNLFNGVSGLWKCTDFPYYYTKVNGDFCFECKVSVEFKEEYDLGSLVIFDNENCWVKFAYELSDQGAPSMITVVTRDISDDCNGEPINSPFVWLSVCRQGNVFAMHYSKDKINWKLARICSVPMTDEVCVGISAQCPSGESCTAYFEDLCICDNPFQDMRKRK